MEGIVKDVNDLCVSTAALPNELEWGQVLVEMKYAAMNPADFYTTRTGGYGFETVSFPYHCGHDGIGTVVKVNSAGSLSHPLLKFMCRLVLV